MKELRDRFLSVRLTKTEEELIRRAAEKAGKRLTIWMRLALLLAAEEVLKNNEGQGHKTLPRKD